MVSSRSFLALFGACTGVVWSDANTICTTTSSCDTLVDLFTDMKNKMPGKSSSSYVEPTQQHLTDIETIVSQMMDGSSCASINLLSLDAYYAIEVFTDTDNIQDYCALVPQDIDFSLVNVVVNQASTGVKDLSFDSPHAYYDTNTGKQGMTVFKGTNARSFVMTGAHRHADDDASTCQSNYKNADAAHAVNGFQAAVQAILDYYESLSKDYTSIQFHGMGSSSCSGVDAFFTHGKSTIAPQENEKIDLIRDQLALNANGTFTVPGDSPSCNLAGSTNVQGRLINGVSPENVCDASSVAYTGRFIHIEQKYWLRQSDMYDEMISAINSAYDSADWAAPPRGITITSPNGGEVVSHGSSVNITWTSEGLNPTDELHLSAGLWIDDQYDYEKGIVWKSPWALNTGFYTWTVPSSLAIGNYVIRIRKQDETGVRDYSDATFEVV